MIIASPAFLLRLVLVFFSLSSAPFGSMEQNSTDVLQASNFVPAVRLAGAPAELRVEADGSLDRLTQIGSGLPGAAPAVFAGVYDAGRKRNPAFAESDAPRFCECLPYHSTAPPSLL
jgi:hypothetical protein